MVEELVELACVADMVGAERVARACTAALLGEGKADRKTQFSGRDTAPLAIQTAHVLAALPRTLNCLTPVRDACVGRLAFRRELLDDACVAHLEDAGLLDEVASAACRPYTRADTVSPSQDQ